MAFVPGQLVPVFVPKSPGIGVYTSPFQSGLVSGCMYCHFPTTDLTMQSGDNIPGCLNDCICPRAKWFLPGQM